MQVKYRPETSRRLIHLAAIQSAALCLSLAVIQPAQADDALMAFVANEGCAIGPTTAKDAYGAGFEQGAFEALVETARANPETVQTGDWQVLSPDMCEITLPKFPAAVTLDDPAVAPFISAPEPDGEIGDRGCVLDGQAIQLALQAAYGWDRDKANLEYIRLLASGIIAGEIAFYSGDALRTPAGFSVISGQCGDIAMAPEIQASHRLLTQSFDHLIRRNAESIVCEPGIGLFSQELSEIVKGLSGEAETNAWIGLELQIIAMAAGWYEGMTVANAGTPRPPLCHRD